MKRILGLLIALTITIPAFASITVSPTKLEINANKIRNNYVTTAIEVKGAPDRAIRYRAYTDYFEISDKSEIALPGNINTPYNISSKIRFVPSEFTIPAGKLQKVRVNVANIKNLPDGESRAIIFLEDINAKEYNIPNNSGIATQLILKTRVGVPVYVDKGNFTKKADIENFSIIKKDGKLYTTMKIASTGNSRVRYSGVVQIIENKKLIDEYALNVGVVAGNSSYVHEQQIKNDKLKSGGEYTLRMVFSYLDEKDNRKNIKKDAIIRATGEI